MAFCDFVVRYDPKTEDPSVLTKRILYAVWVKRIKAHKPCVIFVGGDSGEGKSISVLALQALLLEVQGIDIHSCFDDINVYTPLEYPQKLDGLLFNNRLKKVNILTMHEAREVVKAKNWQSFLTQSVSDVNAMSRSIKRLIIFVISQFIRDITNDIRYTLNFYCIVRRPKGKRARLYINVLWKDDRDLEKPRLRKRKLSGYIKYPDGRMVRYIPQYLEMTMPDADLVERFSKADHDAKASIIRKKLDRLIDEMKLDLGVENNKVKAMIEYYTKNLDALPTIGKMYRGKWKLKPEVRDMHELGPEEAKRFERMLNDVLKNHPMMKKRVNDEVDEFLDDEAENNEYDSEH